MIGKSNFLATSDLKSHLKRHKSALLYSFIIGLVMGSIPFINKFKENYRVHKLIQEQKKMQIKKNEKICKEENSDYKKFLSLGFPKTAFEKFNLCMEKQ